MILTFIIVDEYVFGILESVGFEWIDSFCFRLNVDRDKYGFWEFYLWFGEFLIFLRGMRGIFLIVLRGVNKRIKSEC